MDRREMLLGLAAAATSGAALSACGPVEAGEAAQVPLPLSTTVPINPPSPDYFTPDRFLSLRNSARRLR